jgi:hypothetical protein
MVKFKSQRSFSNLLPFFPNVVDFRSDPTLVVLELSASLPRYDDVETPHDETGSVPQEFGDGRTDHLERNTLLATVTDYLSGDLVRNFLTSSREKFRMERFSGVTHCPSERNHVEEEPLQMGKKK